MFALRQAKADVEKLRLDLRDVKIDKEALGMPEEGDGGQDRLVVVKTVFTRPFHTKDEVSTSHAVCAQASAIYNNVVYCVGDIRLGFKPCAGQRTMLSPCL